MNLLEIWIKDLTKKPIAFLNDKYQDEDIAREELSALFLPLVEGVDLYSERRRKTEESGHVSNAVLQKLYKKIHTQPCEGMIWSGIFWYLVNPLPILMAHDLIDRWIATNAMGSLSRQVDEVQWRLATINQEALYPLVRERYQESQYSTAQFETMLNQYAGTMHSEGIFYMLSFYETPSPEKKAIFVAVVIREKRNWRKWKHIAGRLNDFLRQQSE